MPVLREHHAFRAAACKGYAIHTRHAVFKSTHLRGPTDDEQQLQEEEEAHKEQERGGGGGFAFALSSLLAFAFALPSLRRSTTFPETWPCFFQLFQETFCGNSPWKPMILHGAQACPDSHVSFLIYFVILPLNGFTNAQTDVFYHRRGDQELER
eukprot:CAMPEP_0198229650 /NCGR_PEP_ID=MMETSP1445-20131203/114229_1 /TAXON_ID=36898 /ORGANISM="Pyramimonas sp., Strain CCMP2087" /LENGTH=153 /DNA_ID=CAMNT_0043910117 /DNA_START=144 /DNA_END=605 /DNA_ORIENTATION=-